MTATIKGEANLQDLQELFSNYVLMSALLSWVAAQIIKLIVNYVGTKKLDFERLVGAGGMPSCHTATVCGLTIAMARSVGADSPLFALSFILTVIVIYDATGVRYQAGEHAKILNILMDERNKAEVGVKPHDLYEHEDETVPGKTFKESLGHTPLEVLGGALVGIITAMILPM